MDLVQIILSIAGSAGLSAGAVAYISKKLFEHKLSIKMEEAKAKIKADIDNDKAFLNARIKEGVENALADRAAEREYELEAKKRLYLAIGPLRFQLLLACRDLAGRVLSHGLRNPYATDISTYYGKSTLYRILRPLALTQLIEKQIADVDFSVDSNAIKLLLFRKNALAAFSGSSLVKGHSNVVWDHQEQHVYFDNLIKASNTLIVQIQNKENKRCAQFQGFEEILEDSEKLQDLSPFPQILEDFTPTVKPLFWLRLVGYAYLCNDYINQEGIHIGFEERKMKTEELLMVSEDKEIIESIGSYVERCEAMPRGVL